MTAFIVSAFFFSLFFLVLIGLEPVGDDRVSRFGLKLRLFIDKSRVLHWIAIGAPFSSKLIPLTQVTLPIVF